MTRKINVSIDDWLYTEIENRRGSMNRSEFVSQSIVRGLQLLESGK